MLEFALVVPILMLIVLGIVAFGALWSHKLTLNNASREGARHGVVCGATDAEIEAIVRDRAKQLREIDSLLTVGIQPPEGDPMRVAGNPLTVTATYDDYVAVPIAGVFVNPRRLVSVTTMRIEPCPDPNCDDDDTGGGDDDTSGDDDDTSGDDDDDDDTSGDDDDDGCITATFSCSVLSVSVQSTCHDLSNVVLALEDGSHQKFDGLSGSTGTFQAFGEKAGLKITGVWVKAGSNQSGDGPGYGQYFPNPNYPDGC